jgi:exonuclease III
MRLISWNIAGRVSRAREQVRVLGARSPDVVALQEVRTGAEPILREELHAVGLLHVLTAHDVLGVECSRSGPRQYGVLLASRWPLTPVAVTEFEVPWPERVLSATVSSPSAVFEIHTTGIPPGSTNGWIKVETLEGIYARLARPAEVPRILCGDLNTPREEREDGEIVTWGQKIDRSGKALLRDTRTDRSGRRDTGVRWDRSERNVLAGLGAFDLHDVFRLIHGYARKASSWYWRSGNRVIGRRFDHVFASKMLRPRQCEYLDALRVQGFSDHAPIEVDFSPARE